MKAEVWYNAGMGFTLFPKGVPSGKRLFDLLLTVLAIILLSPVMLGVALLHPGSRMAARCSSANRGPG